MIRQRKPLKRYKALKRSGYRIPQKRRKPRRSERVRNGAYLAAVRALGYCAVARYGVPAAVLTGVAHYAAGVCGGVVEADHTGQRPVGRKASDDTAIPMCSVHHRQRTDYSGVFRGYTGPLMRTWCDEMIERTRENIAAQSIHERPGHSSRALNSGADQSGDPTLERATLVSGGDANHSLKASESDSE